MRHFKIMHQWIIYANIISIILSFIVCGRDVVNGERFLAKTAVMSMFNPIISLHPGPCRFMAANRKQNHQCRKDMGLPKAIKDASLLAVHHCVEQFRYDRWNCSVETRGKRNIFKKLYRETAFVHALIAAALTHSITRACSEGLMTKCSCGHRIAGAGAMKRASHHLVTSRPRSASMAWGWGDCNDNLKYGKRITRTFLELRPTKNNIEADQVGEILRHDSEVGIQAVASTMANKCKCHGISGSCSMKTCWRKLSAFNVTVELLRKKYYEAIRKSPSNSTSRKKAIDNVRSFKDGGNKLIPPDSKLFYVETSPTFCSVTRGRRCLHPDSCSILCCGRGYTTFVKRYLEKCRCRFKERGSFQVICDTCKRTEDRYYCK